MVRTHAIDHLANFRRGAKTLGINPKPIGWLLLVRRPTLSGRRPYVLIYLAGVIRCIVS